MVLTQKAIKKMKETPIRMVEDNPKRLHMSKAEVLLEKAKLSKIDAEVEAFREKLIKKQEEEENVGKEDVKEDVVISEEDSKKIASLEKQIEEEKGPGSSYRKAKLQAQIKELKG